MGNSNCEMTETQIFVNIFEIMKRQMIAPTFSKERKQFMRMLKIKLHFSLKRAEKRSIHIIV